jgi:hypothetical protein
VYTGLDAGYENSGFWFSYADDSDRGESYFVWPNGIMDREEEYADIIEYCDGFCGTYVLDQGACKYDPFVGVGFNLAGWTEKEGAIPVDASAWGGVCIVYTLDDPAVIELGTGDVSEALLGYDNPVVRLPATSVAAQKCFRWDDFEQGGWGQGEITGQEASEKLANIKIKVQAADGTTGRFNIIAISSYY